MVSPVGVPLPSGVVALTASVTSFALPDATGTGMASVTDAAMQAEPSPSGNSLRPQDTVFPVVVTTSFTPGTTKLHLLAPRLPLGGSAMDPERSSTSKISAGFWV